MDNKNPARKQGKKDENSSPKVNPQRFRNIDFVSRFNRTPISTVNEQSSDPVARRLHSLGYVLAHGIFRSQRSQPIVAELDGKRPSKLLPSEPIHSGFGNVDRLDRFRARSVRPVGAFTQNAETLTRAVGSIDGNSVRESHAKILEKRRQMTIE